MGLGDYAEAVVGPGHAGLVADPLADVQGALVLAGGLVVVPAQLGEDAELVDPGGLAGRIRRKPGQGVVDQRGFLVPRAPRVQLADGSLGDLAGAFGVPGLQQVVPGLQQVVHISGPVLRPRLNPPLPVGGRLPVRPGQPLAGLAGGPPGQRGGGPPVHEKTLLPLLAGDRQEAGGLAGGGLPGQAGGRPERRGRRPVQLGEVRRQLLPDRPGDGGQVERLVHGDPGGGQDGGDLLGGGRPVRGVPGVRVGQADREQDRAVVGGFPVHRDPQQQAGGAGDLGQAGQQVLEQDIIGGQRDGLGQRGV